MAGRLPWQTMRRPPACTSSSEGRGVGVGGRGGRGGENGLGRRCGDLQLVAAHLKVGGRGWGGMGEREVGKYRGGQEKAVVVIGGRLLPSPLQAHPQSPPPPPIHTHTWLEYSTLVAPLMAIQEGPFRPRLTSRASRGLCWAPPTPPPTHLAGVLNPGRPLDGNPRGALQAALDQQGLQGALLGAPHPSPYTPGWSTQPGSPP